MLSTACAGQCVCDVRACVRACLAWEPVDCHGSTGVCLFVCLFVCLCVCAYTCMLLCLQICVYFCLHLCTFVYINFVCCCVRFSFDWEKVHRLNVET